MKVKTAERLNNVEEYYFSRKLSEIRKLTLSGKKILNLGIGNPDMMPDITVIDELKRLSSLSDVHGYQPYKSIPELRSAYSKWYGNKFKVSLDPEKNVLPLIGSKEGIMHISMAFLNRGDAVLVPDPGYPSYSAIAKLCGARVIYYNLSEKNNWLPDFDELEALDTEGLKMMWVNYPHMPTGAVANKKMFNQLIEFARKQGILLVNDNPYGLIQNAYPFSLLSIDRASDVALELNSLSKSHNMAGWRLGMIAGSEEYLSSVLRVKSNIDSGTFLPLQMAAIKALELGDEWYINLNKEYSKRRTLVNSLLDELDSKYSNNQAGMFVWSKLPSGWASSYEYSDFLLTEAGIFITPGSIFGTNGMSYLRTSLCVAEDKLKEAIEIVKKIKNK